MKAYRRKVDVILAEQWFKEGDVPEANIKLMSDEKGKCHLCKKPMAIHGVIENKEGSEIVCPGDWVIRTPEGSYQQMSDFIFKRKYERVNPT